MAFPGKTISNMAKGVSGARRATSGASSAARGIPRSVRAGALGASVPRGIPRSTRAATLNPPRPYAAKRTKIPYTPKRASGTSGHSSGARTRQDKGYVPRHAAPASGRNRRFSGKMKMGMAAGTAVGLTAWGSNRNSSGRSQGLPPRVPGQQTGIFGR